MRAPRGGELVRVSGSAQADIVDCIMSVAESRSLDSLGAACHRAIGALTGSPIFGLYMLHEQEPNLLYSRDVPDGFLQEYIEEFRQTDPLLDSMLSRGRAIDGASLLGTDHWDRSAMFDLLRRWGLKYNMCGPLSVGDKIVGLIYTATRDAAKPYSPHLRERMELICRAGSIALTRLIETGQLEDGSSSTVAVVRLPAAAAAGTVLDGLPPRSAEVALRVCHGETNKEIARAMGISSDTVKEHVAKLCRRFSAHNRTELAACLLK
jgi:DNA-binding CsgD family transcriptional regulator